MESSSIRVRHVRIGTTKIEMEGGFRSESLDAVRLKSSRLGSPGLAEPETDLSTNHGGEMVRKILEEQPHVDAAS